VPLQGGDLSAQFLHTSKGDFADSGCFEGDGGIDVIGMANAIHAKNFAGQIKPGDLLHTIVIDGKTLDSAAAHRVNGAEGFPGVVNNAVKPFDFIRLQCYRQTQGIHPAVAAVYGTVVRAIAVHSSSPRLGGEEYSHALSCGHHCLCNTLSLQRIERNTLARFSTPAVVSRSCAPSGTSQPRATSLARLVSPMLSAISPRLW